MEQVLVTLAGKNELVIGIGGQTQASVFKVAPRFPKVKFAIIGGNADPKKPDNVSGYDVRQAEIAFVAGAAAAMLSKTGGVSYVGGLEIPAIKNAGIEFGNGAKYINPKIKYFESYTGDFDDVAKAKEATLAAIAQGADIHYHILNLGLRGMEQAAREKGTHIIGSYTDRCGTDPLYVAYSITGVGFQVEYAIEQVAAGTWKPEFKPFGLAMGPQVLRHGRSARRTPEQKAKLEEIKKDLLSRQDQGARRLSLAADGMAGDGRCRRRPPLLSLDGSRQALRQPAGAGGRQPRRRAPATVQCLLGENGAGKSTLCNLIFGVYEPDAGDMRFGGAPWAPASPAEALEQGIAMVHQHFSLVPRMTVVENLMLGQVRGVLKRHEFGARIRDIAESFGFTLDPEARGRGALGRRAPARRDREVPDARSQAAGARRADRRAAARRDRRAARYLPPRRQFRPRRHPGDAQARRDRQGRRSRHRAAHRPAGRRREHGGRRHGRAGPRHGRPRAEAARRGAGRARRRRRPAAPAAERTAGLRPGVRRPHRAATAMARCGSTISPWRSGPARSSAWPASRATARASSAWCWPACCGRPKAASIIGDTDLTHAGAAAVTAAGGGIVPEDRHAVACVTAMSVAENMYLEQARPLHALRPAAARAR